MQKKIMILGALALATVALADKKDPRSFDADGDGKLSETEWAAFQKGRGVVDEKAIVRWFKRNDLNQDGFVTFAEMKENQKKMGK